MLFIGPKKQGLPASIIFKNNYMIRTPKKKRAFFLIKISKRHGLVFEAIFCPRDAPLIDFTNNFSEVQAIDRIIKCDVDDLIVVLTCGIQYIEPIRTISIKKIWP